MERKYRRGNEDMGRESVMEERIEKEEKIMFNILLDSSEVKMMKEDIERGELEKVGEEEVKVHRWIEEGKKGVFGICRTGVSKKVGERRRVRFGCRSEKIYKRYWEGMRSTGMEGLKREEYIIKIKDIVSYGEMEIVWDTGELRY